MWARTWCCLAGCTASATLAACTFIDIRDRAGVSQVVVRENDALMADGQAAALRVRRSGSSGVVQRRSDDTVNPKLATGEVEVLAREIRHAERSEDAAVPDCRGLAGLRGRPAALPLSGSAPAAAAAQHRPAPPGGDGDPAILRRATASGRSRRRFSRSRRRKARATFWCRAACTPASSTRCRSRRRSSSRS